MNRMDKRMDFFTFAPLPLHEQMRLMEETVRFGGWERNTDNQ